MSIDMSQFHDTFFEESHEHLDELERVLMGMDTQMPDPEELDSIFRAAHSIKGGSGIFGFDALASVTHVMENLLDRVRSGKVQLHRGMVDLLLTSTDTLRAILQNYRNQKEIDWHNVGAAIKALESLLPTQPLPAQPIGEQDSGVFEAAKTVVAGEAFGFFDDEPAATVDHSESASGYGFFEEPAQSDAGFGFFEDVTPAQTHAEAPSLEQEAPKNDTASASKDAAKPDASADRNPPKTGASSSRETGSIRVDLNKVDQLVNLVGELVITQSMIGMIGEEVPGGIGERLREVLADLQRNTRELQESVMSVRMMPVSFVFNRFPRVVRDLSARMNKSIDLVLEGGETEMDKSMIEKLVDPLTHLVRNSIDHGIEAANVRQAQGKPEQGRVVLRAVQSGGNIVIEIEDDGAGLNREKILNKAAQVGLPVPENPTDAQVWKLILEPGFSTADQVTDISGRGVGMDVVKSNLENLGGRLDIHSVAGEGSRFTIQLPLTLAIIDGMGVKVGDQSFILPLVSIVESMRPDPSHVQTLAQDNYLISVRDHYWPVIPLYRVMDAQPEFSDPAQGIVVLIESGQRKFALLVDELLGQQQVVIKSLEQNYKRVHGVAGATIMGDGSVALILDVESLADDVQTVSIKEGLAV